MGTKSGDGTAGMEAVATAEVDPLGGLGRGRTVARLRHMRCRARTHRTRVIGRVRRVGGTGAEANGASLLGGSGSRNKGAGEGLEETCGVGEGERSGRPEADRSEAERARGGDTGSGRMGGSSSRVGEDGGEVRVGLVVPATRVEERMGDDKGITSTLGGSTHTARTGRVGADETVGKRCR